MNIESPFTVVEGEGSVTVSNESIDISLTYNYLETIKDMVIDANPTGKYLAW